MHYTTNINNIFILLTIIKTMKPIDKFNRPINKKTFEIISGIGDRLFRIGYGESSKKPNLFYFNDLEKWLLHC